MKPEFEYYLANQADLVQRYNGKYVVIKHRKVIGVYADQATAVSETAKTHELGTFLVQKIEPGSAAHSQTFHSRATFGPAR